MAKFDFDIAIAFATQSAEGTYNAGLDAISATLDGDPDNTDDGLVLGDPESGIGESGVSFAAGRRSREKAVLSGGFTKPLADFLAAEVRTLSFSFPFCGSRRTTTVSTPIDADFIPLAGVDAILVGAGMAGTAWGSGVGHSYKFATSIPISCLLYYFGNRLELLDCRVSSLSIDYTPGSIAVATADISVGSIKDPASTPVGVASLPTLDYGTQATVSAPTIESVANAWSETRGFQSLVLTIANAVGDIKDSNATDGILKDSEGRETTIEATLFADDTTAGEVYELDQVYQTAAGGLDQLSFQVGADETTGLLPAVAHQVLVPTPELDETAPQKLGTRAGNTVKLIARNVTVNEEIEIIYR